jgi:hypothetical protein
MTMFPFHTLVFTLWFVMVGPGFISSDDSFQEVVTLITIAIQKLFADFQMLLFVQFFVLLWDPSCTDFMEGIGSNATPSTVACLFCRLMP